MTALSIATATVAATAGGLSLGWRKLSEQVEEALVSPESGARSMGAIYCRMRGEVLRSRRHVSLIGHLLVVGRAPGFADRVYSLVGAQVDVSHAPGKIEINVVSPSGQSLATFWPTSEMEMMRLSAGLSEHGLPSGVESESLTDSWWLNTDAEIVDWEQQISKALDDPQEEEPEWIDLVDLNSRCQARERTASDIQFGSEGWRGSVAAPERIHLSRKQIAELTSVIKHEGGKISKFPQIFDRKREKSRSEDEDEDEDSSTTAGGPVSPFSDPAWDATNITYNSSIRSMTFAYDGDGANVASESLQCTPRPCSLQCTPCPCSRQVSTVSVHSHATSETQLWSW